MQTLIVCPICGKGKGKVVITDPESGEIICSNCGMVMLDRIEETKPEWRNFRDSQAKDKRRTGSPGSLARHDMGLYTIIGYTDKDAKGQKLDASTLH